MNSLKLVMPSLTSRSISLSESLSTPPMIMWKP